MLHRDFHVFLDNILDRLSRTSEAEVYLYYL